MPVAEAKSKSLFPSSAPLAGLFFFSGLLALVYEALWQRRFALVFGSAAPATAASLAAYFAGLAFGSYYIGARVGRFRSALKLYALLECGIALGALMVEVWLRLFDSIHPPSAPGPASLALKTFFAFIALALPTFCMGGTLPALGAFIDHGRHQLGRTAGLLYVLNTAGAAIGVLLFPLLLLPAFGARNSLFICAAGNLLLAAISLKLSQRWPGSSCQPAAESSRVPLFTKGSILAFASGFVAFIVQVQWNRAFAQVHENSLYSFAVIAAVFIAALAAGGQLTRLALARNFTPEKIIAAAWIIAGLLIVASPFIFLRVTGNLAYIVAPNGWWNYAVKLFQITLIVVFPAAVLMGMAFPAILERAGREVSSAGKILGWLLTLNLLGGVLGALGAGFLLPQSLGLWGTMTYAGILSVGFGIAATGRRPNEHRFFAVMLLLGVGLFLARIDYPRTRLDAARGEKLLVLTEGPHGIVAVTERGRSRRLKLNNSYVLGGTASTGDERMQSHLPLLMHPNPQRVAYLGLGTGISAGGSTFHPVTQATLLELVPEAARAAREFFAEANARVLEQPSSRLIVEDARNFLRHTPEKFDVIIGDLVVPWRAGEAALFTQENFRAGKNALTPGGIFCQWLPLFQLSEDEFRVILNTFLSVFPEAHLWRGDFAPIESSLALIGFSDGAALKAETIRLRLRQMKPDPANPQLVDDFALWMYFAGIVRAIDVNPTWRINSENRPWVELMGPLNHSGNSPQNLFVGRRLQRWLSELPGVSMDGEREFAAVRAGEALAEFTLSLSEGNESGALGAQHKIQQLCPAPLYQILFPPGQ